MRSEWRHQNKIVIIEFQGFLKFWVILQLLWWNLFSLQSRFDVFDRRTRLCTSVLGVRALLGGAILYGVALQDGMYWDLRLRGTNWRGRTRRWRRWRVSTNFRRFRWIFVKICRQDCADRPVGLGLVVITVVVAWGRRGSGKYFPLGEDGGWFEDAVDDDGGMWSGKKDTSRTDLFSTKKEAMIRLRWLDLRLGYCFREGKYWSCRY